MSALPFVSDTFDPARWREVEGFTFHDITYHRGISRGEALDGRPEGTDMPVVRIAFDRPEIRNAFRPLTVKEMIQADPARAGRLHILEVQRLIRTMPKVVGCYCGCSRLGCGGWALAECGVRYVCGIH